MSHPRAKKATPTKGSKGFRSTSPRTAAPKLEKPERQSSNELSSKLVTPGKDAFGRDRRQQDAVAVPVLRKTFALLVQHGWLRPHEFAVIGNGAVPNGWHLIQALQSSGPKAQPDIECWYARRSLMRVEPDLCRWEAHPARTQEEVLRFIAKAIELAGGVAPPIPAPIRVKRRGGWAVGGRS